LGGLFFNFSVTAADARVRHQPDRILQTSFAKQRQGIGQTTQQIRAIRFAQGDNNRPAVTCEGERNCVEKILVRRDEDCAVRLRVGE
jgi:hypothetical protein